MVFRKKQFWVDIGLALLFFVFTINAFFHLLGKPSEPIDAKKTSVIKSVDSLSLHSLNPQNQRILLLNVLQERMAIDGNSISTTEDTKMQIRLFYAAILAGIISLAFSKNNKTFSFALVVLIGLMYLLEIHRDDLFKRQVAVFTTKAIAVDSLINLPPQDSTWYELTSDDINIAYNRAEETRLWRKVQGLFQPNPEQILFYLVPFYGVYILNIRKYYKVKK